MHQNTVNKYSFKQIIMMLLIGVACYAIHRYEYAYKLIDDVIFRRHTIITGTIIIPFLFGAVVCIFTRKLLALPVMQIAIGPFIANILVFLFYRYVYTGPTDNIGIVAPFIMFLVESFFIAAGALSIVAIFEVRTYVSNKPPS